MPEASSHIPPDTLASRARPERPPRSSAPGVPRVPCAPMGTIAPANLAVDHLDPTQWSTAAQFYKAHYLEGARLKLGDEVFVLRVPADACAASPGAVVAAVRLTLQSAMDATCLHCLAVDRQLRRQGAASQLLTALVDSGVLGRTTCYCFSLAHLEGLYRRFGFETVSVEETDATSGAAVHATLHPLVVEFFRREQARRQTLVLMARAADAPVVATQRDAQPSSLACCQQSGAVLLEIHSRLSRGSGQVVLEIHPAQPPTLSHADTQAETEAGTQAGTHAERWAAGCVARGLGYLTTQRARQAHELPPALFEQLALERACEGGAANSMEGVRGSQAVEGADNSNGAGAAIDAAIEWARPAYEQTYATLPRRLCGGCGLSQRWFCAGCLGWLDNTPSPAPFQLPFHLEVVLRDEVNNSTGLHAAMLATPVRVRRFPQGLRSGTPAAGGDEEWIRYDPATTLVLYPSAGGVGTRELARLIREAGATDAGPQGSQRGGSPMPPQQQPQQRRLVTVIIVDSKWNNDGAVLGHPSLRGLRHLHLEQSPSFSRIWRSNRLAGDCG